MKRVLALFALTSVLQSCGVAIGNNRPKNRDGDEMEARAKAIRDEMFRPEVVVSGSVVSAFPVTVDGMPYPDLENFYTQELKRLPEKVRAAGFDDSYKVEFNANVGFTDLWNGMSVFVLANGKTGAQAMTYVNGDGSFKTYLEPGSENNFKVRAVKRISIILTKEKETKQICYNFSAKEQSVHFSEKSNPIILNDFTSDITSYKCESSGETGLQIPHNPNHIPLED
jgi:hypothetical protein